jgi:hypothetical protein
VFWEKPSLVVREDAVEGAWRIVNSILEWWKAGPYLRVRYLEPPDANQMGLELLLAMPGGEWYTADCGSDRFYACPMAPLEDWLVGFSAFCLEEVFSQHHHSPGKLDERERGNEEAL